MVAKINNMPLVRFLPNGDILIPSFDNPEVVEMIYKFHLPGGTYLFCNSILHESFKQPWTEQRIEYLKTFEDESIAKAYGLCYRGFAKSTFLWALQIKGLCLRRIPFDLFTSRTLDHAETQTDNVKQELLGNELIREIFGNLKPKAYEGNNATFSKKCYFIADPITGKPYAFVLPKGEGQQCNGSIIRIEGKMERPTFQASDDGEDRDLVNEPDQRMKHAIWYYGAFEPTHQPIEPDPNTHKWKLNKCGEPRKTKDGWVITPSEIPPWLMRHQDTCKHEASNMMEIVQAKDWYGHVFPEGEYREDADGDQKLFSLVPELVSDEQLREKQRKFADKGMSDIFAMEHLCSPQDRKKNTWTKDGFQYYEEQQLHLNTNPYIRRFITVDPSRTMSPTAADTSILAWAIDPLNAIIWIRGHICKQMTPETLEEELFAMCQEYNTSQVVVEETGLKLWISGRFENAASKRGVLIDWLWIEGGSTPRGDYGTGKDAIKRARSAQALPFYSPGPYHPKGHVWHEISLRGGGLEHAMLSYPKNKKWDGMDTLGYIPQVMQLQDIFFHPQSKPVIMNQLGSSDLPDYSKQSRDVKTRVWALYG